MATGVCLIIGVLVAVAFDLMVAVSGDWTPGVGVRTTGVLVEVGSGVLVGVLVGVVVGVKVGGNGVGGIAACCIAKSSCARFVVTKYNTPDRPSSPIQIRPINATAIITNKRLLD